MSTLFLSDVHLSAARPLIVDRFVALLGDEARRAARVYILGDLFDEWLGDDDARAPHGRVVEALASLTASGVPVGVVPGNHDFLLSSRFEHATGCTLLGDATVEEVHGERVLLMHGDTLCTQDESYQTYRRRTRNRFLQRLFLSLSLATRARRVADLRRRTRALAALKPADIMDVDPVAVDRAMRTHGVRRLIHGHTHRPATHRFELDGEPAERIVLADWYERGSVLERDASGFRTRVL